jgi:hypothetical protein
MGKPAILKGALQTLIEVATLFTLAATRSDTIMWQICCGGGGGGGEGGWWWWWW